MKYAAKNFELTGTSSTTDETKPSQTTTKLPKGTAQLAKNLFTQVTISMLSLSSIFQTI